MQGNKGADMKRKKKVNIVAKCIIVCFAIYASFTLVSLQMQISEKKAEQRELMAAAESQALENAEIKALLESPESDEYVARIAREKLGYISPGERVFIDISSK